MKKQSIAWHEDCLKNAKRSLEERKKRVTEELQAIDRDDTNIRFREAQIAEAKKRRMLEFDNERLLVKKSVKSA